MFKRKERERLEPANDDYRARLAGLVSEWSARIGKNTLADVERDSERVLRGMTQPGDEEELGNGFLSQQLSNWRQCATVPSKVPMRLYGTTLTKIGRYHWGIQDADMACLKARIYLETGEG